MAADEPAPPSPPSGGTGSGSGRLLGSLRGGGLKARAQRAGAALRAEFEAGKRGDEAPVEPIWLTPRQQLDGFLGLLRSTQRSEAATATPAAGSDPGHGPAADATGQRPATPSADGPAATQAADAAGDGDAAEVATALGGVDWAKVKAATAERTSDAAQAMRAMAEQVDWAKVQPVAARLSSALMAAAASGQLGMSGRLGSQLARTIADQGGLGQQVDRRLQAADAPPPPDFRPLLDGVIDTTARDE